MSNHEIINRISVFRIPVRLKEPFIISLGRLDFADNVVVIIETAGGLKGYGECSPFQTIHGETGATGLVVGKILAGALLNEPVDIPSCSATMDRVIFGNTSIKSAFDIALHDIAAQQAGLPLYRFLGGRSRELVTDYTVSIGPPVKMAEDAAAVVKAGFTIVKVKLGGKAEEDFLRIKMIRERVGNEIPIRIDANQGWDKESAISLLNSLHPFNIQHCEEPVSRKSFMELADIRQKTLIPIMADESCFDETDAERLINLNACDLINVKLGKSSGIFKAQKIIRLAEKSGIDLQAGGFLESRLGFTAIAHLALSSEHFKFIDFDTPLMFSEDLVDGGISYGQNGKIAVPEKPGLGANIPAEILHGKEGISMSV